MARITEDQLKTRDPLGEIARTARALFHEAGNPSGKSYLDFVEEAEELLLSGRSSGNPTTRSREPHVEPVSAELLEVINDESRELDSIVATVLQRKLNEHEGFCLYRLLQMKALELKNGRQIKSLTPGEIGTTLSRVAEPLPAREGLAQSTLWQRFLEEKDSIDEALHFHDRNTMQLLERSIVRDPRVLGFREI